MKRSNKYRQMLSLIDRRKRYFLDEAIGILKKMKEGRAETVSIAMKLGIAPKRTDQFVKGSCVPPSGLGKTRKVLVFAKGEKEKEVVSAHPNPLSAGERGLIRAGGARGIYVSFERSIFKKGGFVRCLTMFLRRLSR